MLKATESGLAKVLKTTLFLNDLDEFQKMNVAYERAFGEHAPGRSTLPAARLPLEIECIAGVS